MAVFSEVSSSLFRVKQIEEYENILTRKEFWNVFVFAQTDPVPIYIFIDTVKYAKLWKHFALKKTSQYLKTCDDLTLNIKTNITFPQQK